MRASTAATTSAPQLPRYASGTYHSNWLATCALSAVRKEWVFHCQLVGSGVTALKYLELHIFRVAISNNRILKLAIDQVAFGYKDADTGKNRYCTVTAEEFIRRFLQHVLPKGFVKVRYCGFFSPTPSHLLN